MGAVAGGTASRATDQAQDSEYQSAQSDGLGC